VRQKYQRVSISIVFLVLVFIQKDCRQINQADDAIICSGSSPAIVVSRDDLFILFI
jgi:hypothetical protein